jgi:hypothetical protein
MTTADLDSILGTYAEQRALAVAGARAVVESRARPLSADLVADLCLQMFDGGIAAAHDRSLQWHYIHDPSAAPDLPDVDISMLVACDDGTDQEVVEAYYDDERGGWVRISDSELLTTEVYAWADIPAAPSIRKKVKGKAVA